jgi:hypothetical protein
MDKTTSIQTDVKDNEKQVDQIENLLKKIEKEPTAEKIKKLNTEIKTLNENTTNTKEKLEDLSKKENPGDEEKKEIETLKKSLTKLEKDISRLTKALGPIMKKAKESEKRGLKQMGDNLEDVEKNIQKAIVASEELLEAETVTCDDFEGEANTALKKVGTAKNLKTAGKALGEYLRCVTGNIDEASGITGLMSEAFSKVFGNKGKDGFNRLTSIFLKGKTGTPTYLSELSLSMSKAAGTKEDGLLGRKALFEKALNHVWLIYLKECIGAFKKKNISAGSSDNLTAERLKKTCEFWTTNYTGQSLEVLTKDYKTWKKELEDNIKKDLESENPNKTDIKMVKNALIGVKNDIDKILLSGISAEVSSRKKKSTKN